MTTSRRREPGKNRFATLNDNLTSPNKSIESNTVTNTSTDFENINETDTLDIDTSKIKELIGMVPKKKNVAKTYYMKAENVEKLEKFAKRKKLSPSKVINELIEKIL